LAIYLNNEQSEQAIDLERWQAQAEAIAARVGVSPEADWSLTFVDDAQIQQLNRDYRGLDKPTDVLSFSQLEGDDEVIVPEEAGLQILGDVIISTPTAARHAHERGHAVDAELALLITHGLLHLLGEDHDTPENKAHMWKRQQDVLDHLGVKVETFGDEE
jgi:probable rRNA maturation factor